MKLSNENPRKGAKKAASELPDEHSKIAWNPFRDAQSGVGYP